MGHAFLEPLQLRSLCHIADLNIAVHLGWQKKGIGTKLLERIIELAKNSEVLEKIQLNVRASNFSAISLYQKMGFTEEGRIKNRVKIKDRYIDDLIMGLDLRDQHPRLEMHDTTIREMQEKDIDTLVKAFCFPWNSVQATSNKWKQYYAEHQKHIRTVYLLEKQGQIIGYASLLRLSKYSNFKDAGIPEVHDVRISEEWRKKGFGKMLILHIENRARTEGYKQIGLGVGLYADYGPAQKLYFQLGYKPNGKGITYKTVPIIAGEHYLVDDDLILWLTKYLP